ncbi:hypothetical protein ACSLOB_29140, partial [Escherichia coli]
ESNPVTFIYSDNFCLEKTGVLSCADIEIIIVRKHHAIFLLALHLVKESIPIYGADIIKDIYSSFKYKESYIVEINTALKVST